MGWKEKREKREKRKLRRFIKEFSNCNKHYWVGSTCALCGLKVTFEPNFKMTLEEEHRKIIEFQNMVDKVSHD